MGCSRMRESPPGNSGLNPDLPPFALKVHESCVVSSVLSKVRTNGTEHKGKA